MTTPLHVAVVTETFPLKVNGVATTLAAEAVYSFLADQ